MSEQIKALVERLNLVERLLTESRTENVALREDKARLDWLEIGREGIVACWGRQPPMGSGLPRPFEGFVTFANSTGEAKPLREAIDEAMKP